MQREWFGYLLVIFLTVVLILKNYYFFGINDAYDIVRYISYGDGILGGGSQPVSLQPFESILSDHPQAVMAYPSPLFQILSSYVSRIFNDSPSIVNVYIFSSCVLVMTNIFIYKTLRLRFSTFSSVSLIALYISFFPFNDIYVHLNRPLTGPFGVSLIAFSLYKALDASPIKSGVASSLAIAIRSQVYQIVLLMPLLFSQKKQKLRYIVTVVVTFLFVSFILQLITNNAGNSNAFYFSMLKAISLEELKDAVEKAFFYILSRKLFLAIYLITIVPIFVTLFKSDMSDETSKLIRFQFYFSIIFFFGTIVGMFLFVNDMPTERYFIYFYPIIIVTYSFILMDFFKRNRSMYSSKYTVLIIFALLQIVSFYHKDSRLGINPIIYDGYEIGKRIKKDAIVVTNNAYIPYFAYSSGVKGSKFYRLPNIKTIEESEDIRQIVIHIVKKDLVPLGLYAGGKIIVPENFHIDYSLNNLIVLNKDK